MNQNQESIRPPVTLSTGSVIVHSRMPNGATAADRTDGEPLTHAEWEEYCALMVQKSREVLMAEHEAAQARRQEVKRMLANPNSGTVQPFAAGRWS